MKPTVLFVDDEPKVLATLKRMFMRDCEVLVANEGTMALELLQRRQVHVVVCDQRMPGMSGIEVLQAARQIAPQTVRVVLTGYADLEAAIDAVNKGEVYRYVSKPWSNEELLVTVLAAAKIAMAAADAPAQESTEEPATLAAECGILILDKDRDLVNSILFGMGDQAKIFTADTPDNAMQVMNAQDIGVLVADSDVGGEEMTSAITQMRSKNPDLVVIIVTFRADIVHVMDLINRGHIFRFIPKPTNFNVLQPNIQAAIQAYFRTSAGSALKQKLERDDHDNHWA